AAAEAVDLVTLPARAKTHLSEAELVSVVNFSSGGVPLRLAAPHGFATQSTSDLSNTSLADISANDLSRLLNAAVSFWVMAGLDGARADMLSKVEVRVADLPRDLLGVAFEHRIVLDVNGAGTGWHLDFDAIDGDLVPADRVDLLTALGHELGHLLGLEHSDAADDLMSDSLASGARHRPWSELVDELFSQL
ncbi:MAG: matrixin family metalloprotease, partial [Planctomycetia bacterium]|nr:matrixin family metalloprotease [Planctomycetia bacterium]